MRNIILSFCSIIWITIFASNRISQDNIILADEKFFYSLDTINYEYNLYKIVHQDSSTLVGKYIFHGNLFIDSTKKSYLFGEADIVYPQVLVMDTDKKLKKKQSPSNILIQRSVLGDIEMPIKSVTIYGLSDTIRYSSDDFDFFKQRIDTSFPAIRLDINCISKYKLFNKYRQPVYDKITQEIEYTNYSFEIPQPRKGYGNNIFIKLTFLGSVAYEHLRWNKVLNSNPLVLKGPHIYQQDFRKIIIFGTEGKPRVVHSKEGTNECIYWK